MKKIAIGFAVLAALLLCSACGGQQTEDRKNVEVLDSYDFRRDFSDTQGYRGWSYYYGDSAGEMTPMIYQEGRAMYMGPAWWSRVSLWEVMAAKNLETIICWTAPADCVATVSSTAYRKPPQGYKEEHDGVLYYGFRNKYETNDDLLFSEIVRDMQFTVHEISFETEMKAGDTLFFVVNCRNDTNNDNSVFDIHIELSEGETR